MKKGFCFFMLAVLIGAAALTGCKSADSKDAVEIWSKQSTVRVLQDITYEDSFKNPATLVFKAARNEFESTQLILTPDTAVASYDLIKSDLKNGGGTVFSKENIELYNQKYLDVISASPNHTIGTGVYPDALLPFEVAKAYGENTIRENENQGIWVEIYVPENQPVGIYNGTFTLTVDKKSYDIPVSVEVWNYTVSKDVHLMGSYQMNATNIMRGELDATSDIYGKYLDALTAFRLQPFRLSSLMSVDDDLAVKEYQDNIRKYTDRSNPELKSYLSTVTLPLYEGASQTVNGGRLKKYIDGIVKIAVEDNINYLALCVTRAGFIDEPHYNGTWAKVEAIMNSFNQEKNVIANAVASTIESDIADQIVQSIRDIPNYITTPYDERLPDNATNLCIPVRYAAGSAEYLYNNQSFSENNWWYSVGTYRPSFSLDVDLLDTRLHDWMAFDYGFKGDLAWDVAFYYLNDATSETATGKAHAIDPYTTPLRNVTGNGDGFLFYPGKAYGIDGPVSSIRIHALRDGREEYEYLYHLESLYRAQGLDVRGITSKLSSKLYSLGKANPDPEIFSQTREALYKLIRLAGEGIFFSDYSQFEDRVIIKIQAKGEGILTTINGEAVSDKEEYTVENKLDQASNYMTLLTASALELNIYLGGSATVLHSFRDGTEGLTGAGVTLSAEEHENNSMLKAEFSDAAGGSVGFSVTSAEMNNETESFYFNAYNPSNEPVYMYLYLVGSYGETRFADFVIESGYHTYNAEQFYNAKWHLIRNISAVRFDVSGFNGSAVETLYFDGFTVIG